MFNIKITLHPIEKKNLQIISLEYKIKNFSAFRAFVKTSPNSKTFYVETNQKRRRK